MTDKANTIDEYIKNFPEGVQQVLRTLRQTIREIIPDAEETVSYGIPTFKLRGKYVVYFAGYKDHVSVYPIPSGDAALQKAMEPYKAGKGTLRFPLDKAMPLDLIRKVAVELLAENERRAD